MTKVEAKTTRPTDEELMLFVDEELDGERHAEVAAFILEDVRARRKVAALRTASSIVREGALESTLADGIADAVMASIESDAGRSAVPFLKKVPSSKPSNDNSRRIFAFAAVAAAAAAALMIWGKGADRPADSASRVAMMETTSAPAPTAHEPASTATAKPEGDSADDVAIAAVDFGARTGTIFYVPNGTAAKSSTTAVVWVNDDGPEGL